MTPLTLNYENRSSGSGNSLHLEAAQGARPGRFVAALKDPSAFRLGLTTLGGIVRSDYDVEDFEEWLERVMDPVVGIHPDGLSFEAFSNDVSALGWVHFDNSVFGEPSVREAGCTNIDYSLELEAFLNTLSPISKVEVSIGTASGLKLKSSQQTHHEKKISLPDSWKQAFGELHAGLLQSEVTLPLRRPDLLNLMRWIKRKAKMNEKGRALRFQLTPGEKARVIVEPWNQTVRLGCVPEGLTEEVEWRVYGRRRLAALEALIPHLQSGRLYLLGDSRPSYWEVNCRGMRFVFALSSWSARKFSKSTAETLRGPSVAVGPEVLEQAANYLSQAEMASFEEIAGECNLSEAQARNVGLSLCRAGLCCAEPQSTGLRWRPIHQDPLKELLALTTSNREDNADALLEQGMLSDIQYENREGLYIGSAIAQGRAGEYELEATLQEDGSFQSASCTCAWMRKQSNSLKGGPCKHLLALRAAILKEKVKNG